MATNVVLAYVSQKNLNCIHNPVTDTPLKQQFPTFGVGNAFLKLFS